MSALREARRRAEPSRLGQKPKRCPGCHRVVRADDYFCAECGGALRLHTLAVECRDWPLRLVAHGRGASWRVAGAGRAGQWRPFPGDHTDPLACLGAGVARLVAAVAREEGLAPGEAVVVLCAVPLSGHSVFRVRVAPAADGWRATVDPLGPAPARRGAVVAGDLWALHAPGLSEPAAHPTREACVAASVARLLRATAGSA